MRESTYMKKMRRAVSFFFWAVVIHSHRIICPSHAAEDPFTTLTLSNAITEFCNDPTSAAVKYGDIATWDTSVVTSMSNLLQSCSTGSSFNEDITAWDVSQVTSMTSMFDGGLSFNQLIGSWDVGRVTSMRYMFRGAAAFDQELGAWDVSKVTGMSSMFQFASSFNLYVGAWDVGLVTIMSNMFQSATAFNQALCWDLSGKFTTSMFSGSSGSSDTSQGKCSCIPGTYYTGATCAACPAGQFSSRGRSISCQSCTPGTYASATGQPICLACDAGKMSERGSTECFYPPTLSPTTFSSAPTQIPTPYPTIGCAGGTFHEFVFGFSYYYYGAQRCVDCPMGRYRAADSPIHDVCEVCPAGRFQGEEGKESCVECPLGKLSSPTRYYCDSCSVGQYAFNATECIDCEQGKYAPVPQTGACLACGAGLSTKTKSAATQCTRCDAGTWSSDLAWNCTLCTAGTYSASGQASCSNCPAGFFAPDSGSLTCAACAAGFVAPFPGAARCSACAPGHFQGASGQQSCIPCEAGFYAANSSSLFCAACDRGFASAQGGVSCSLCTGGYYRTPTTGECAVCPDNGICQHTVGTALAAPKRGYWLNTKPYFDDVELYRCPRATCSGSSPEDSSCWTAENIAACSADALLCTEGATGVLCGACESGYTFNAARSECVECSRSTNSLVVFSVFFALAVLFAWAYRHQEHLSVWATGSRPFLFFRQIDSGTIKVIWAAYQVHKPEAV